MTALPPSAPSLFPLSLQNKQKRKGKQGGKEEDGKGEGKSQRVRKRATELIKRGSLQECKGFLFLGNDVFLTR